MPGMDIEPQKVAANAAVKPWFHCKFPFKRHGKRQIQGGEKADVGMHSLREDATLGASRSEKSELHPFRIHEPIEI